MSELGDSLTAFAQQQELMIQQLRAEVARLRAQRDRLAGQITQLCEWPAELPLLTEDELELVKAAEAARSKP